MKKETNRVVLIGTGFVGASYAFALLNQSIADELVLLDVNMHKARGEAMDLNHGLPYTVSPTKIWAGTYADCQNADVIVITAGVNQKPGETRLDLIEKNEEIFREIMHNIVSNEFGGVLVVATNPVDIMTYIAWKYSNLPKQRVIGSGTTLDTARLRYMLGEYFAVDSRNVPAYIIGEHGDTELPVWSHATIGARPILSWINQNPAASEHDLDRIFESVRDAAYEMIACKSATYYGIAMSLARLTKAILNNENAVFTVSVYLDGMYSQKDIYIGVPAIVNRSGIRELIPLDLNVKEQKMFTHSAQVLRQAMQHII